VYLGTTNDRGQFVAATSSPNALRATTDGRGQFVVHPTTPGPYVVQTAREGYAAESIRQTMLSVERPQATVAITMYRPGRLTARVIDGASGKPLANVPVAIVSTQGLEVASPMPRATSPVRRCVPASTA
jgi:hypothetical protein